jgi:1,4-dihydroxy-2-naphthoate octaprenyltransferase
MAGGKRDLFDRLDEGGFSHAVVAVLDDDGYPVSVATSYRTERGRGVILLDPVAQEHLPPLVGREANVVFSHIRPQPGVGYDERRYVNLWGTIRRSAAGDQLEIAPAKEQGWDEQDLPFFEYAERGVPQARRYLAQVSLERGRTVRPKLSFGWLFLRATRLPFLTATVVPILLGIAVAAADGFYHWPYALLTLVGGMCIHLGLNVANDVFDTMSGADEANTTPTQFSGGSRVIHYGLISLRGMILLAAAFYVVGMAIGLYLAVQRGFWPLVAIGAVGVVISIAYTAPPFRLVHRGVGEFAVALGFGPVMVLGAYYVQAQRLTAEAWYVSLPVAILIALVLYMNEVPDRAGDARAGKRTLPVRLPQETVIRIYVSSLFVTYALIAIGAITGITARPTIIALATIPLAMKALRGLRANYESPYALMPAMATNIQLHLFTGLLLFVGYLVTIVVQHNMTDPPAFLT